MPLPNRNVENEESDDYNASDLIGTSMKNCKSPLSLRGSLSPHKKPNSLVHNASVEVLSTPPPSRQRRHSRMHLRVASEISVDQTGTSSSGTKDRYRIVIMGSSAVGKTAIVEQFLYGTFPVGHSATVEELHKGEYDMSGSGLMLLEILDTSGSYEFPAMRRLAVSTGEAFILVFSIDNTDSFEEVKNLREMVIQVKGTDTTSPPIVIVGNKSDLPDDKRLIQFEMAECECIDWDLGFVECSAKNNENIGNIFSSLLMQAHLKGMIPNFVPSSSSSPKHHNAKQHNQRRRSSLPISELFHHRQPIMGLGLQHQSRDNNRIRKRNSCTPS